MPELPEVHTTVEGLKKLIKGKTIKDVWSDFHIGTAHGERRTIKNKKYFENFKKIVKKSKIIDVERRGKNILIYLNNKNTIVVHMKMTGHLMVGKYKKIRNAWIPTQKGPLQDPYNKFIHFVASLSNRKHLVLSDMRKFASVTISKTNELHLHETLGTLGPEPLDPTFSFEQFYLRMIGQKNTPIKSALLNQSALAGIGNIYSDEILWETSVFPLSPASKIPKEKYKEIFKVMKKILLFSISKGGDSKSDYRNAFGEKGGFQDFHKVYGKKGKKCPKLKCSGIIERIVIKGRSSHFCPIHQKIYK